MKIKEKDKLIIRYSEFKLAFLTVVLLFFIVFPFFLPARISIQENLVFVFAVLATWLFSAVIYLLAHLAKWRISFIFSRYAAIVSDIFFLTAVVYVLAGINSNYFFLFAFIILGASFYLDEVLVIVSGFLSAAVVSMAFFLEFNYPFSASLFLVFGIRLIFILAMTYFVYLFVLSYKGISIQREKIKKISSLNQWMLNNFTHQLRAPLPVIRDFIELLFLQKAGKLNDKQKSILATLHSNTKKLIEESSSLVYYNQIKTGELHLDKKESNLVALVEEVIRRAVEEEISKNITICYLPRKKVITSLLDEEKISMAIYYFLVEIILLARKESKINVSTYASPYSKFCRVRFAYSGRGIVSPTSLNRDNLDIYVADKIVSLQGGNINLIGEGRRQKLEIILPLTKI